MYETIELGKFQTTKGDYTTQPFTISFVLTPDNTWRVVKGMSDDVDEYVKKHFPICLCNKTYWKNGKSRSHWTFYGIQAYISWRKKVENRLRHDFSDEAYQKHRKARLAFQLMVFPPGNEGKPTIQWFRRVPRKWLDVYNLAAPEKERETW
jgi:hypothetical protein